MIDLKDLLSQEIKVNFKKHLHISEKKIKQYIHAWPEQIYEIIIMMQKNKLLNHYVFPLPTDEGTLEFKINTKTKKIDIYFHDKNHLKFQRKFKELLGKVYEDIEEEVVIEKLRQRIEDSDTSSLTIIDEMINNA